MSIGEIEKAFKVLAQASSFGIRQLNDGTRLFGRATHVAPEAWLHLIFPPLIEAEVEILEQTLRRQIPKPYRTFLTKFGNGINIFSGSLSLDGMRKSNDRTGDGNWQPFAIETPNLYERPRDAESRHFFIGGFEEDGSLLYLENDKVIRCDRASVKPLNEWGSLSEMIGSEVKRLSELFDEYGRKRDPDKPTTP